MSRPGAGGTSKKNDFAKSIELRLVQRGMSKQVLAKALGFEPWQISRLLRAKSAVGSPWAEKAALKVGAELGLQAEAAAFLQRMPTDGAAYVATRLADPNLAQLDALDDSGAGSALDERSALQKLMGIAPNMARSPFVYLAGLQLTEQVERTARKLLDAGWQIRRLVPDKPEIATTIPSELEKFGYRPYEVWRMPPGAAPFLGSGYFVVPPGTTASDESRDSVSRAALSNTPVSPGLYVWWGENDAVRFTEPDALISFTNSLNEWCAKNLPAVKSFSRVNPRRDVVEFERAMDAAEQEAHDKNGTIRLVKAGPGYAWMDESIYERRRLAFTREADEELALQLDEFQARRRARFTQSSDKVGAFRKHILTRLALKAFSKRGLPAKDECFLPFMDAPFDPDDRAAMLAFARSHLQMPGDRYQICLVRSPKQLPRYNRGRTLLWEVVSYDAADVPAILFLVTYPDHGHPLMYIVSDAEIVRFFCEEFDHEWARLREAGASLSVAAIDELIELARTLPRKL